METEQPPAEESIQNISKPKRGWFRRRNFARYSTEVFVIFIGITSSFLFDEWRGARKDKARERELIKSLIIDLNLKTKEIEFGYTTIDESIVATKNIQSFFNSTESSDSSIYNMVELSNRDYAFFGTSTPTYEFASNTDSWLILPDSLRRSIHFYYYDLLNYSSMRYSNWRASATRLREAILTETGRLPYILSTNDKTGAVQYEELNFTKAEIESIRRNKTLTARLADYHNQLVACKRSLFNARKDTKGLIQTLNKRLKLIS